mgnify:CR=1 FL=1
MTANFKKLINQGMILGESAFVFRLNSNQTKNPIFFSKNFVEKVISEKKPFTEYKEYKKIENILIQENKTQKGFFWFGIDYETTWKNFTPLHSFVTFVKSIC